MNVENILDKIIKDIKSEINGDTEESNYIEIVKDIYNKLTNDKSSETPSKKLEDITFTDMLRHRANATVRIFNTIEDKIRTFDTFIKIIESSSCERVVLYREYGNDDVVYYFINKILFIGFKSTTGVDNIQSDVSPEDAIKWLKKELDKLTPTVTTEEFPFHNRQSQINSLKKAINTIVGKNKIKTFYISTISYYPTMATIRLIISNDEVKLEIPSFIGLEFDSTFKYDGIQFFNIINDLRTSIQKYQSKIYSVLPYDTTENKIKSLKETIEILNNIDVKTIYVMKQPEDNVLRIIDTGNGLVVNLPYAHGSICGTKSLTAVVDYMSNKIKKFQEQLDPTVRDQDNTPSDIYSELYTKFKTNKYLTVLSSDTTEQFTTAEVKIDGEMYSVLYVKPELYETIKSKYTNKTLKFMNADLLLIQASLTEFIEFIKSKTQVFTVVKMEDLNQGDISGSEFISTIKYFNDKAKNGNVTLNVIGELVGFLGCYPDYKIRIVRWNKKSPEDFISIVNKIKIIDLNIISNDNLLNYEVNSTFNLFSFLRLYFGI